MCEECIEGSLKVTGQLKVICPLCKTVNEENPLHVLPVLDDWLLEQQQKEVIGLTLTVEKKRKRDQDIFDGLYEQVVRRGLGAPDLTDL